MTDPDLTRRRALTAAAAGGLTLPLLTACGGGSSGTAGGATGSGPTDPGSGTSGGSSTTLTPASDVPVGGGVILKDANIVVTQPTKGTFEGFSATCTHQGCQLANVASGTINCGCHGSQYSIKDGSVVSPPAPAPLPKIPVKLKGSNIIKG